MRRWTVRAGGLVVGIALVGLVSVVAAPPASAHAELTRSTPADGATLRVAPGELVLSFSESVERHATHVRLTDGHGREVAPGALRFVKTSGAGMETSSAAIISLPPLAPDVYRVAWRTLSSDDLHSTDGVFVFGLQRAVGAQAAVPRDPPPGSAEVALRWLTLLSMACAFGAGALLSLMDDRAAAGATVRAVRLRLLGLVQAGLLLLLASSTVLLVVQATAGAAAWQLLGTAYGARWLARAAAAVILLVVATVLRGRMRRGASSLGLRRVAVLAVPASAVLGLGGALIGHAGAGAGAAPGRLAAAAVHGLAATVWTGAVIAAAVALLPWRRPDDPRLRLAVLTRFGGVAAVCLLLLVVTGLVLAADGVASLDALVFSVYGRALLLKLALVLVAAVLGLTSTLILRPAAAARWLGRQLPAATLRPLVVIEALVMVALLIPAAGLASAQPAIGPRWRPPAVASGPVQAGGANDLVESLSIAPNRPGRTFLTVSVLDTRRPAPAPVIGVAVTLRGPDGHETTRNANPAGLSGPVASGSSYRSFDGWVVAGDDITAPGLWRVRVVARRPGLPDAVAIYRWTVANGAAARPARLSGAPLAGLLGGLAWLLTGAGLIVVLLMRRRRGRAVPSDEPTRPAQLHDRAAAQADSAVLAG